MWASLLLGIISHQFILLALTGEGRYFADGDAAFAASVFVPTALSTIGMFVGSMLGRPQSQLQLDRFFAIMNTPIGQEHRLVEAGITLPALIDANLTPDAPEKLNPEKVAALNVEYSSTKRFGPHSNFEFRREADLAWYWRGFTLVTLACVGLVAFTWLTFRVLFVWR
jgi:hypothetical protein